MSDQITLTRPESVGLSSARLQRIDDHFRRAYIDPGHLAGAVTLVCRRGALVHFSALGQADREAAAPMRTDTLFRIYSMTKPLTSVLFMMLVEEGKVALDDRVDRYIPQWRGIGVHDRTGTDPMAAAPPSRPMLVVDLLRHTSGLTYGFQERTPIDAAYRDLGVAVSDRPLGLAAMIDALAGLPLEFSPGDHWNYSVATDVLGHLIGVIEGRPFETVLQDRLLGPLGMADTGFQVRPDQADRFAACYISGPDRRLIVQDEPQSSPFLSPPTFVSGGGGLVSTVADYLRFCRMMLNGGALDGVRYLSPKTVALMTANHLPGGADLTELSVSLFSESNYAGVGFGLGVAVAVDPVRTLLAGTRGEYFWGGAASTYFWIDPVEELIVILMTQLMPTTALPMRRDLRTLVYAAFEQSNV